MNVPLLLCPELPACGIFTSLYGFYGIRHLPLWVMLLFLFLISLLAVGVYIVRRQRKHIRNARRQLETCERRLSQTEALLSEANRIKSEYVGHVFSLNSEYIVRLEQLYRTINRKLASRQYDDLRSSFKESALTQERNNMYVFFDETFLRLFPNFVTAYNRLFPPGESTRNANERSLTPEMRIFALIRLGINDPERIARFLNYSVHTIHTYKTRVKKRSIVSNDMFEERIMEIKPLSSTF